MWLLNPGLRTTLFTLPQYFIVTANGWNLLSYVFNMYVDSDISVPFLQK